MIRWAIFFPILVTLSNQLSNSISETNKDVKVLTFGKVIKGNNCTCTCFCVPENYSNKISPPMAPNSLMEAQFKITKVVKNRVCECACSCGPEKVPKKKILVFTTQSPSSTTSSTPISEYGNATRLGSFVVENVVSSTTQASNQVEQKKEIDELAEDRERRLQQARNWQKFLNERANLRQRVMANVEATEKTRFSCTSIHQFVRSFEIKDPSKWIQQNCQSLLKSNFPNASCEQISRVFISCFD